MRRTSAILLLAVFSLSLMSSALLWDTASNLPPCCRNNGKHRCAMGAAEPLAPGMTGTAIRTKCPYFPASGAASAHPLTALLNDLSTTFGLVCTHPAGQAQTEARYRV